MSEAVLRRAFVQAVTVSRPGLRSILTEAGGSATEILSDVKQTAATRCMKDLPGPEGFPLLGTAPEYFRPGNRGRMHEVQRKFHQKYGKMFREKLGPGITNISVADPVLVEELLRHQGKYPLRPPYPSWLLYKELRKQKTGLMTAVNDDWHRYRSVLAKKLLRPKAVADYLDVTNDVVTSLMDRIRHIKDSDGNGVDVPTLANELHKWALESGAAILLDTRIGCLENNTSPKVQEFINSVGKMFLTGHQLIVFADIHKRIRSKTWVQHVQAWDTIYSVGRELIDNKLNEVKQRLSNETGCSETSNDLETKQSVHFLEYLLGSRRLSMDEIYSNTTELLLSGVDTVSNTLAFALHLIASNPRVQDRVVEEVDRVVENRTCSADDINKLSYTKAVVKETLRLYPVIPINARVLTEDVVLDSYLIPKGTCVLINNYTMHRDEKNFHNPDDFVPERWVHKGAKEWHPFTVIPFGFGSRSCVGRRIGQQELYLAIVRICQNFRLRPREGSELKSTLRTMMNVDDIPVQFVDR
ncbi:hypothetical protein ScPMuIL_000053 [Solemya velum]